MRAAQLHRCWCAAARLQLLCAVPRSDTRAGRKRTSSSRSCCIIEQTYVSQPVQLLQQVPVPLCKRAGEHPAQLSALLRWKDDVVQQIDSIKDSFEAADGGPCHTGLQKEVTWVLEDAVAAWREMDGEQWVLCSWQQLETELAAAARRNKPTEAWQVLLRVPVGQLQQLWQLRLKDRVPFQYLISTAHWRDLILSVGPGVLIPRPETEMMIDLAAAALATNPALKGMPWADLGCGSGALAIGLAKLLQQRLLQAGVADGGSEAASGQVFAVDLSETAVAYTSANSAAHQVQHIVLPIQGSWCEPLQQLQGKLGGLLSNPPYIPSKEIQAGLQAEVAQHEPMSALNGGPGAGMDSLQVICEQAIVMLAPGGYILLETAGAEQAPLVQRLLQRLQVPAPSDDSNSHTAFADVVVHQDCYGVPRFVSATRTRACVGGNAQRSTVAGSMSM